MGARCHDIVVIGASFGGLEAITKIAAGLPKDLQAAVFAVIHTDPEGPSILPAIVTRSSGIPAYHALDGARVQAGKMFIAPPDHHLQLEDGHMRVLRGPRENRHRPAIDPLFRSAAVSYGPRVVGVILTGYLDDGVSGLKAIKNMGGKAMAQDPRNARVPSMPLNAIENVQMDYVLPISQIAPILVELAKTEVIPTHVLPSAEMQKELAIGKLNMPELNNDRHPGQPSIFSCPECGGVLWEIADGNTVRYRCRVGHAFSLESIQAEQQDAVENALWIALKTLEETASLMRHLLERARRSSSSFLEQRYTERLKETEKQAGLIRNVILQGNGACDLTPECNFDIPKNEKTTQ